MLKRGFKFTLLRELSRMGRYRTFMFSIVVIPILSFLLLVSFFWRGVPNAIPIAVLDNDNTATSRKASDMVSASRFSQIEYDISSLAEGHELMNEGKIQAILVLPKDMERSVMRGEQVEASLFVNGVNLLMSSLIQKDVIYTMQTFSTGVEIQKLVSKGVPENQAYQLALPINYDKHILFDPYINYAYYLLPGFMPMILLLFTILSTIFVIGIELKRGTASMWVSSAGGSMTKALTAKLLPYTIIMSMLGLFMNVIMFRTVGIPLNGSAWLIALGTFMFILAYQAVGVLIISVLANLRLSLSIGAGYSVLAFTFSGLTFPAIAMDALPRLATNVFPFTPYINLFVDQSLRGAPIYVSLQYLVVMAVFILLPIALLARLKSVATNKAFFGKL